MKNWLCVGRSPCWKKVLRVFRPILVWPVYVLSPERTTMPLPLVIKLTGPLESSVMGTPIVRRIPGLVTNALQVSRTPSRNGRDVMEPDPLIVVPPSPLARMPLTVYPALHEIWQVDPEFTTRSVLAS